MGFRRKTDKLMKELLGFNNLPADITGQISEVVEIWKKHMGDELVGIYLHGSVALNAFCPDSGDIDLLVVVRNAIATDKKLDIARDIILTDGKPRPLEMSAIRLEDARNWVNNGKCVFHYSDFWTDKYLKRFLDPKEEVYVVDHEFPDADVTSYIRLIKEHGIVLYGRPTDEVFSDISDEDFWNAISSGIDDYRFDHYNGRYLVSNILILGRILSFKAEKKILSKYEAGIWMISHVPSELKYLPEAAMKAWFEGSDFAYPKEELESLRLFLIHEIKR